MNRLLFASFLLATQLSAFSTTNIQYLYGDFEGPTFLDTQGDSKQTITAEHYRTFDYGDAFAFFDYVYANKGLRFSGDKNDLYGEISPRLSLNKIGGFRTSEGLIKEYYAAFQYNGSNTYHAWLYGIGSDLNIPGFSVFGLNLYRKIQNIGIETYQLSANYYAPLSERWHFEGFSDWTTRDFLSQNQLLFNLSQTLGIKEGKLEVGTEWHYYHENNYHSDNDVFQAMIKYVF
ncbi:MAG: outer membrane protein OmpK [Sulfuricurvum sp.]|uniref:outer membrane protein OmpK n=1 Tax=Sulfuricurvum sp. TaxID=2025608 RepID=UPI002621E9C8|nr:outer membrane protein OmpK [Sulfuricurvum sp.]MDD5161218.1 outer membrane protein OmpK [Sulfuricurvum sp.]